MMSLQFGSLDFNALSSVKGFGSEIKQNIIAESEAASATLMATKGYANGEAAIVETVKESNVIDSYVTDNQFTLASSDVCIDGRIHMDSNPLHGLNGGSLKKELLNSIVLDDGSELVEKHNGFFGPTSAVNSTVNAPNMSSEKLRSFRRLIPRGLINSGNLCFLNATLQVLLSCSPFVQLLLDLRDRPVPKVGYPTLDAFVEFIAEFCVPNDWNPKNEREGVEEGKPFNPIMFETVLSNFTSDIPRSMVARPRQEDAQEFLSFVMDQMHDELLKLDGHSTSPNGERLPIFSASNDDGWETVGPKNKSAITRTQSFIPSELSAIFGGQLRSVVKARGNKASATVQPYLLLHLDIFHEAVYTIEDALRLFSAPETLEGYRSSSGKAGLVSASKSLKIQTLSKILILHLMRFSYGSRGSTKLHKPVHFPLELILGRELLVSPSTEGRKYELVATITHHGREHSKGHYTADCRYSNGRWLRYDDSSVRVVGTNKVLHDQAYVLFYKQV
ncbi:hypothetical protein HPP92_024726 [Vanilla planifolia]|uniref:Ubiquitin carboxyl-terminal hydrolase n=1 Tax=Vanilla planifolia TaxID=51239 RepID=A0A835PKU6_VANPL|nr:hypothetical protein HPP92_024726 [Vanilla planifolia]